MSTIIKLSIVHICICLHFFVYSSNACKDSTIGRIQIIDTLEADSSKIYIYYPRKKINGSHPIRYAYISTRKSDNYVDLEKAKKEFIPVLMPDEFNTCLIACFDNIDSLDQKLWVNEFVFNNSLKLVRKYRLKRRFSVYSYSLNRPIKLYRVSIPSSACGDEPLIIKSRLSLKQKEDRLIFYVINIS